MTGFEGGIVSSSVLKPDALNGSSAVYREIFVLSMGVQQMKNSK